MLDLHKSRWLVLIFIFLRLWRLTNYIILLSWESRTAFSRLFKTAWGCKRYRIFGYGVGLEIGPLWEGACVVWMSHLHQVGCLLVSEVVLPGLGVLFFFLNLVSHSWALQTLLLKLWIFGVGTFFPSPPSLPPFRYAWVVDV